MTLKTLIIGASGHGKVVLDILQLSRNIEVVGFIDNNPRLLKKNINGIPVIGDISILSGLIPDIEHGIVAIGDNFTRARIFGDMQSIGFKMINAIHPDATIARSAILGNGIVISARAVINPNAKIGEDCIINTGAIVDHDNLISDHVHISPGVNLAGNVSVGYYSHVGIGASVINDINIGQNVTIGAGAVVIKDIPDNAVVVGVPAKIIKYNDEIRR